MKIDLVAHSEKATVGHAGLSLIGEMARISGLDEACLGITRKKQPQISDPDILRSLCGLIAQGKTDFDHIRQFAGDSFFQAALEINRNPSAEILRQRFQEMSAHPDFGKKNPAVCYKARAKDWREAGAYNDRRQPLGPRGCGYHGL